MTEIATEELGNQMKAKPGIYFGLNETVYHDLDALGSTDLKNLSLSPEDWWWTSKHNPLREGDDTASKSLGTAIHTLVLEGREVFDMVYAPELSKDKFVDLMVTANDLRAYCEAHGLPKSGDKTALIERVRDHSPAANIWDVRQAEYAGEIGDREILNEKQWRRTMLAAAFILKNRKLAPAFQGGMPEVSIVWEHESGVLMKGRFDYLQYGAIIDLKSISLFPGQSFKRGITQAIGRYRYDIQAAHYCAARVQMADLFDKGLVYEFDGDESWLKAVCHNKDFGFMFVFQKTVGAPTTRAYPLHRGASYIGTAENEIERAIEHYTLFKAEFGLDNVWIEQRDIEDKLEDVDMPAWMGLD